MRTETICTRYLEGGATCGQPLTAVMTQANFRLPVGMTTPAYEYANAGAGPASEKRTQPQPSAQPTLSLSDIE